MSLEASLVKAKLGKEDILIGHDTSDSTITVSVDAEFQADSWHIPINSGHGDVISETIKQKNTGLINMKESENSCIDGVSLQGELSDDQIKLEMETGFNEILEIKDECRDNFTEGLSIEAPLYTDNEFKNEQGMPDSIMPDSIMPDSIMPEEVPVMPQLCNVFTEQVLTEAPSTWENPRIDEENMQLHLESVYLTNDLTEWNEEAGIQDELCNLEAVDLTDADEGLKSETNPGDVQEESFNLKTELPLEDLLELKVEPSDVGVSLGAQELYADHEVKDEVVLGPVVLTRPDVALTAQEVPVETVFEPGLWEIPIHYETKQEPSPYIDVTSFGARGDLYMNHEVKTEIELQAEAYIQELFKSHGALLGWTCSVQLERIHVDKERRTCRVGHETYKLRGPITTGHAGDQRRFTFDLSRARQAIQNKLKLNSLIKLLPTKKTTVSPSTFKGQAASRPKNNTKRQARTRKYKKKRAKKSTHTKTNKKPAQSQTSRKVVVSRFPSDPSTQVGWHRISACGNKKIILKS